MSFPDPFFPLRFLLPAILLAFVTACGEPSGDSGTAGASTEIERPRLPAPSNLLLITVDTLRADHLSSYGYPRATSPRIDRLAEEGVRFDLATVQWPKTGPSFASMMTSTHPSDNGIVRRVGIELPCAFRMLAEELRDLGYGTHAVVANGALAKEFRFDQGFDTYVETWKHEPESPDEDPNGAEAVNRRALEVIEGIDREKPFFLWVHYLDPHYPYAPPGEYRDRFQDDEHYEPLREIEVSRNYDQEVVQLGYNLVQDGRTDLGFYVARYDAEIAYADEQIGRLLDSMGEEGLLERTMTVFTSDHGESLGEHWYYFDHGRFSFDTCQRVPLIVHYPGVIEPGVVEDAIGLVDLAPTLLEAAGADLSGDAWMQGRSFADRLLGVYEPPETPDPDAPYGPVVFAEAGVAADGRWQRTARDQRFKLVYVRDAKAQPFVGGEGQPWALYDRSVDPGEAENLVEKYPDEVERLKRLLWAHTRDEPFAVAVEEETCADYTGMDQETEDQLRALGYID